MKRETDQDQEQSKIILHKKKKNSKATTFLSKKLGSASQQKNIHELTESEIKMINKYLK